MASNISGTNGNYFPFVESDPNSDGKDLRATLDKNGYLFFRALVPVEDVLKVRRRLMELFSLAGWLDTSTDPMKGIVSSTTVSNVKGKQETSDVYRQILRLPEFNAFPSHPALIAIAQTILDDDVTIHPRRIARMTLPGSAKLSTPPHQDFFYVRGSVETYTCWVPLGDCPKELGSLAVWAESHRLGFIEHNTPHPGAIGGHGVLVDESQTKWHTSDFCVGDALFFHSHTIHKALPNLTADRIRLSTDNRYQHHKDTAYLEQQNLAKDVNLATIISAAADDDCPVAKTLAVSGANNIAPDTERINHDMS